MPVQYQLTKLLGVFYGFIKRPLLSLLENKETDIMTIDSSKLPSSKQGRNCQFRNHKDI
jgi:hypothetical protein